MPLRMNPAARPITTENYQKIRPWGPLLYGKEYDVGGGAITREEIDLLLDYPRLRSLSVMGLHQDTFDYFVRVYGSQFDAIFFWKNKLVGDLSALGELPGLRSLGWYVNERAEKLWDLSGNVSLQTLYLDDFTRLHTLAGLEHAPALTHFTLCHSVGKPVAVDVIPDLSGVRLEQIMVYENISCQGVLALLTAPALRRLTIRCDLFPTEFLAWASTHYPHVNCETFAAWQDWGGDFAIRVNGKRKPFILYTDEKAPEKRRKAEENFSALRERYREMDFPALMQALDRKTQRRK